MLYTVWILHFTGQTTTVATAVDAETAEATARRLRADHGLGPDRIAVLPAFVAADAWDAGTFRRVATGPRR